MKPDETRKLVKEGYGKIALEGGRPIKSGCCGLRNISTKDLSKVVGYSQLELEEIPDSANLGLGCGNPTALASIKEGQTVLDLGSGAGIDCFLAAKKVGKTGKVIGVDMTEEMIKRANENAKNGGYDNVEFHLGEIENLPVDDNSVDVIISNCVINLSPEKDKVFREAFRVLKPGGRIVVSDIVILKELPQSLSESAHADVGCVAGAEKKEEYLKKIENAGFSDVIVKAETYISEDLVKPFLDRIGVDEPSVTNDMASSIKVEAVKRR